MSELGAAQNGPPVWSSESSFLAFDLGKKSSGVAYGSLRLGQSQALGVIQQKTAFALEPFAAYINEWSPSALVVGVPFHPDGQPHENTRFARRVAHQLRERFGLVVIEVDERYSPTQALSEGARAHNVDALSACVILNQFFDQIRLDATLHASLDAAVLDGLPDPVHGAFDRPNPSPSALKVKP